MNLLTRMAQLSYPISMNCWNAGERSYDHFDTVISQNGKSPKTYLMNIVYNFGHMFDALREFYFFFSQDQRGIVGSVHDAGYNLGFFVYILITPGIVNYKTNAVDYRVKKQNVVIYTD